MLTSANVGERLGRPTAALRRRRTYEKEHGDVLMQFPLRPRTDRQATERKSTVRGYAVWTAEQKRLDPQAFYGQFSKLVGVILSSYGVGV